MLTFISVYIFNVYLSESILGKKCPYQKAHYQFKMVSKTYYR